ncbi:MAG: hypothetical protein O3B08_13955, partial [Proteobacteria bacterium]|nr:hypothetical protein [Pseudomonadota bacterium]
AQPGGLHSKRSMHFLNALRGSTNGVDTGDTKLVWEKIQLKETLHVGFTIKSTTAEITSSMEIL